MLIAPDARDEDERLRILDQLGILDSPPEKKLDDITELAAHICQTPIALISLIDRERQWFKSRVGLDVHETPREMAFCLHAMLGTDDLFVVPDALLDDRFRDNPLVTGPPYIRFYAGAPLLTPERVALGSLCVIDRIPRELHPEQLGALQALRRYVTVELEQKRTLRVLADAHGNLEQARQSLSRANDDLETKIRERTERLSDANRELVAVVADRTRAEAAVRRSEEHFRATFNQAAVGMAHVALDGTWLAVNGRLCEIVGYSSQQLLARTFQAISHPADLEKDLALVDRLLRGEIDRYRLEKRYLHKEGHEVWVNVTVSLVRDAEAQPDYFIAVIEDITERVRALERLRHAEARLRSAAQIASLGYWEWNPANNEVYFSAEWKRLLGYAEDEIPDRFAEWESRLHDEDRQLVRSTLARFLFSGVDELQTEFRLLHKDGDYRYIAARAVRLAERDGEPPRILITHLDVTPSRIAERRIREAALHDPLTGLPNRALIFEYAAHIVHAARRGPQPGAILFIDLDRFKIVNDTYGHKAGDAVLQEVAARLRRVTRAQDVVGRIGGDEFLVILPDVPPGQGAETAAQHLLDAINAPIAVSGVEMHVSPSIGICDFPRNGASVDDLVRCADLAMYRAKQAGQNRYERFSEALEREYSEYVSIEKQLKLALLKNAFALHYQPIVEIETGRVVSVEALLRWPGVSGRGIGPSQFIPIAEAAGIISRLSEWAVGEACRQHRRWIEQALPPLPIALNVSPVQFQAREFGEQLTDMVRSAGVHPSCLQLEVTESMLMQDIEQASRVLARLKELGLRVALDDFGTGYSSLAYLSQLPLDKLKVDQSFVRRLDCDPACSAITEAIIALGQTLKLQIVAEGIESRSSVDRLRSMGCEQGQGYYYSRPICGDDFVDWHAAHQGRRAERPAH